METLLESSNYILAHEFEDVILKDKNNGKIYSLGSHYGDPVLGLIAPDESWFITAGEGLLYFDFKRGLHEFFRKDLSSEGSLFVHSACIESNESVRILIDPWSEYASTWILSIPALKIQKIKNGPLMIGKPWQEKVFY
ncbi:hypothetical protein [Sulfurovum mangrovi]|uniref:hypothetical protein n=1 Tax=Sulfurovum mangrovi TaxID=2893889 RepID=UPI001E5984BB|nr:hypothetical protein [Sulfurovum mangrovi]UFH58125.1 hypothetical protein LN246_07145 [Sulfurovum mangrovi]